MLLAPPLLLMLPTMVVNMNRHFVRGIFFNLLLILSNGFQIILAETNTWLHQNPSITANSLNDIYFISRDEGWIVGDKGTILHTLDSGMTWTISQTMMQYPPALRSVFFHDRYDGWTAGGTFGRSYILHTIDGGKTWLDKSVISPNIAAKKVYFQSDRKGWLVLDSRDTNLMITEDGGNTWKPMHVSGSALMDITFVNDSLGIVSGDMDFIGRTTNGGNTWRPAKVNGKGPFNRIQMLNSAIGYCISQRGQVIKTSDTGNTWDSVLNVMGLQLNDIFFADTLMGIVEGGYSPTVLFKTLDGGKTWQYSETNVDPQISALHLFDKSGGIASAWNGAVYNVTGLGDNFTEITSGTGSHAKSIDFYNGCAGCVGLNGGQILLTENSGKKWDLLSLPTNAPIEKVMMFSPDDITAIFKDSCAVSYNRGHSWEINPLPLFRPLGNHINGTNTACIALGNTIMFTNDNGKSWSNSGLSYMNQSGQNALKAVYFKSQELGWACNNTGTVIRTTNGSLSWDSVGTVNGIFPEDIFFIDDKTGWVSGYTGTSWTPVIQKTKDGGVTWAKQSNLLYSADNSIPSDIIIQTKILKIRAVNIDTAWALSDKGVLFTSDGGIHWIQQTLPQYGTTLFDIFLDKFSGSVWVVGSSASIWKFEKDSTCSFIKNILNNNSTIKCTSRYPQLKSGHLYNLQGKLLTGTSQNIRCMPSGFYIYFKSMNIINSKSMPLTIGTIR